MIGKIKARPGRRAELVALLATGTAGTAGMPGCLAYVVAEDMADDDGIWITEIWQSKQHHTELAGVAHGAGGDREGAAADRGI